MFGNSRRRHRVLTLLTTGKDGVLRDPDRSSKQPCKNGAMDRQGCLVASLQFACSADVSAYREGPLLGVGSISV